MTEPTHLRLANGWTVSIARCLSGKAQWAVSCAPTADEEKPWLSSRWHQWSAQTSLPWMDGHVRWVAILPDIVPLLLEAAALEPPR